METRTPACARGPDRDERIWTARRTGIAVAASCLIHAAVIAAVTVTASLTKPPASVEVEEAIAVEVVDASALGIRVPLRLDSMPIAPAAPQAPDPAIAAVKPAEDAAVASPPVPAEASRPPPADLAAAPPASEAAPPAAEVAAPAATVADAAPAARPEPPAPAAVAGIDVAARADDAELPAAEAPSVESPVSDHVAAMAEAPPMPLPPGASEPPPAVLAALTPPAASPSAPSPAAPDAPAPAVPAAAVPAAALPAAASAGPETRVTPPEPPAAAADQPAPAATELAALAPARPLDNPVIPADVAVAPPTLLRPVDPRDAVAAALKGLDCSHISATVDILDGTVALAGHARSEADRQRLAAQIAALAGITRVDDSGLRIVGEPYCRVLGFLDRPEFQRSSEQRYDISTVGATNQPGLKRAVGGEALPLTLSAPEFDAYLYVDHFSADGRVTHLLPTDRPDNFLKADQVFRLGPGERGRRAVISPPYGLDVITVLAASEALFVRPRPLSEEASTYIAALDERLRSLTASGLRLRYEYAYYLLATEPPPRPSH